MKTVNYNPSSLELEISQAIFDLKAVLGEKIKANTILDAKMENGDNPSVVLYLKDNDGDEHEVVIKVIQRQDKQ